MQSPIRGPEKCPRPVCNLIKVITLTVSLCPRPTTDTRLNHSERVLVISFHLLLLLPSHHTNLSCFLVVRWQFNSVPRCYENESFFHSKETPFPKSPRRISRWTTKPTNKPAIDINRAMHRRGKLRTANLLEASHFSPLAFLPSQPA